MLRDIYDIKKKIIIIGVCIVIVCLIIFFVNLNNNKSGSEVEALPDDNKEKIEQISR